MNFVEYFSYDVFLKFISLDPMHFEVSSLFYFQINVMLHNAGKSQRARWEYTDLEVDKDVFNLNVFSVVNLSRCIMPHFMKEILALLH